MVGVALEPIEFVCDLTSFSERYTNSDCEIGISDVDLDSDSSNWTRE